MTPSIVNLTIVRGDDFKQQFQILTCDSAKPTSYPVGIITAPVTIAGATFTPLNMTGGTFASQIRQTVGTQETLFATFSIVADDLANGIFSLTLAHSTSQVWKYLDSATYAYDIQFTNGGVVTTYISGEVVIILDQTRI